MDIELLNHTYLALVNCTYGKETIENVLLQLNDFEKALKKIKNTAQFIQDYYNILCTIQYNLYAIISDNRYTSHKDELLDYRNRIFLSKLNTLKPENIMRKVTDIFNDFIKGITWFDNEKVFSAETPAYHRHGSCPERGNHNENCNDTSVDNLLKAERLEKCYIERLIYNDLWEKIMMMPQNKEHLDWLENTKRAYLTCFKDTNLEIQIEYSNKKYIEYIPETLHIKKNNEEYTYYKEYLYNRRIYIYPIDCRKKIGSKIYKKKNYGLEDNYWKEISTTTESKKHGSI